MEEILVCRLCLATNVKLFNMYKYQLVMAYENLTGFEMKPSDKLLSACVMCCSLLVKSASFQQTCRNSQDLLHLAERQRLLVTTEYIDSLKIRSPYHNFQIKSNDTTIECSHVDQELKVEPDWGSCNGDNECVKSEKADSSDEEPLASKIVKRKSEINDKIDSKPKRTKKLRTKLEIEEDFNSILLKKEKIKIKDDYLDNDNDVYNDFREGEVDIIVLTKEEQIAEVQARRTSLNYRNSLYKCNLCYKGFITDATYKNHMLRHDQSRGKLSCEVCATRWESERAMRAHAATSHERKFLCKLCSFVSKNRNRAKEHSKWHEGHRFVCKFCGALFSKSTSHLTHIRLHHPSKHTCEVCGASFIGEIGLKMHKKKAHVDNMSAEFKAELCCGHCNTQFLTLEAIKRHSNGGELCDLKMRPCVQCGELFSNEEDLIDHLKDHSREEPVKCEECDRTFLHARSYTVHYQRTHARRDPAHAHGKAPGPEDGTHVVCEVCGKKCMSNATLRYHQRIHTGERPFQCTECPKKFSVFQRLQIHRRTHSGERPYKCNHCPKAFKHKAALNRHDRVHSGAKPYACPHCGKAFSQSNSLKLHVRTVHLKIPSPYRSRRLPAVTADQ